MLEVGSPFEFLELQDGQSQSFSVLEWGKGRATVTPTERPQGKEITVIRVAVPPQDKPTFPHYWDLSASTLVAQIEPHLRRPDLAGLRFTVTARGIGLKKRFQLDVVPS